MAKRLEGTGPVRLIVATYRSERQPDLKKIRRAIRGVLTELETAGLDVACEEISPIVFSTLNAWSDDDPIAVEAGAAGGGGGCCDGGGGGGGGAQEGPP